MRQEPAAVADAGPLIHLAEIREERALRIFGEVLVPGPVAIELRARTDLPGAALLRQSPARVVDLRAPEKRAAEALSLRFDLGLVDATVLAVARTRAIALVATDDFDLRDGAKLAGLRPVGTLGILLRAAATGTLTFREADRALDALLAQSSLFVTRSLVEEARAALRRAGKKR